jgi:hypothetical protein
MNITFQSEDDRKTKFFAACIHYLTEFHGPMGDVEYEEIYEGMAAVSQLLVYRIGFKLDDGRTLGDIPISSRISQAARLSDSMYILAGRQKSKWWLLDVISVGSIVDVKSGKIHVTFNPLYVNRTAPLHGPH